MSNTLTPLMYLICRSKKVFELRLVFHSSVTYIPYRCTPDYKEKLGKTTPPRAKKMLVVVQWSGSGMELRGGHKVLRVSLKIDQADNTLYFSLAFHLSSFCHTAASGSGQSTRLKCSCTTQIWSNTLLMKQKKPLLRPPSPSQGSQQSTIRTIQMSSSAPKESDFSVFTSLRYDLQLLSCPANTAASSLAHPTPFYLLSHHHDRLLQAAENFSFPTAAISLLRPLSVFTQRLQDAVDAHPRGREGHLRVCWSLVGEEERAGRADNHGQLKAILTRSGEFTIEIGPVPVVSLSQLYPEALPLPPVERSDGDWRIVLDTESTTPSEFTSYKTTVRKMYDDARIRARIRSFAERKEVLLWNEIREVMEGSLTSVYVRKDGEGWVTPMVGSGGQRGTTRRWVLEGGLAKEGVVMTEDVKAGDWVMVSNGRRGIWGGWVV